jgi:gluconate 2-dehydrogenase subunit 3-like protein
MTRVGAFSRSERSALSAIVEWAVPADDALAEEVVSSLDDFFGEVPLESRLFVRSALLAMEHGARLRHGRPLSGLEPAARDRYLRGWLESRRYALRSLAKIVVLNVLTTYYSRPAVQAKQGFHPEALVALREKLHIVDPRAVLPP